MAWSSLEQQEPPNADSGLGELRMCVVHLVSMGMRERFQKWRPVLVGVMGHFVVCLG